MFASHATIAAPHPLFSFPHNDLLFDARLDAIREEPGTRGTDIALDLRVFESLTRPRTTVVDGRPHEVVEGDYRPLRLRFRRAAWVARTGPYADLDALAADDEARRVFGVLHARQPGVGEFFWLTTAAPVAAQLALRAREVAVEERDGARERASVIRRWAPTPQPPAVAVPHRPVLYHRFGGDPIAIHLNGRLYRRRLFIGGLHHQRAERPAVDHVLNLCGVENGWVAPEGRHADDRYSCKGEMAAGMDVRELVEEATWVVGRLRAGKRVLVHCYAGINRSSTTCCAALILLEGISADEALARVRERHPSAWPDPYHWFLLRWLADHRDEVAALDAPHPAVSEPEPEPEPAGAATLLRP